MDEKKIIDQLDACLDCKNCLDACDTYAVTQDINKSPNGRLKIAKKLFLEGEISDEEIIGLYTCTLCAACELVCPQEIPIADLVHSAKIKLVDMDKGPLENHKNIIKGIMEKDNSVNGNPEERLDWLPAEYLIDDIFDDSSSDTLLFFGCMSSFRVKESATNPFKILKKAGYDFKIMKDEPCCGEYVYSAGRLDLALKIFEENINRFKKMGIKKLIVTCGGCLYAFDKAYRKYFEDFDIEVKHVIEVINDLVKKGKIRVNKLNQNVTIHDACRLGRKYLNGPIFSESRELLESCGLTIEEITEDHMECPCCGAGSGIRGVDSSICIKIGAELFKDIQTNTITSGCPLCVFNFRYVNYKNSSEKKIKYLTDYVFEALEQD